MRKNHIVFKCAYLFLMLLLFFIGYRTVEVSDTIAGEQGEIVAETESGKNGRIEQILEGTKCPLKPEKEGVMIERTENLEIPEDSILENWKIYEFKEDKNNTEETAEQMGKILLGSYFSKAEKNIEDYGSWKCYRLNYRDEEVSFNFKSMIQWGDETTFIHKSRQPELEEPEDGNWETVYLQRDKELLQQLELGIWDGEQGYLELAIQQQLTNSSRHVYEYKLDGKSITKVDFNFHYNMMPYATSSLPVTFEYQNGVLTELKEYSHHCELENIRDAEIKYNSIEEILEEAEKKVKMSYSLDMIPHSLLYFYFRIEGIQLYYMGYCYGELEKKYAFVPMAEIQLTEYIYDLKTRKWSEDTLYYGIQLETGEGSTGKRW